MQEHRLLIEFRKRWNGKRVMFMGQPATVVGVGDDGYRAESDARRRAKPTGLLFLRNDDGTEAEAFFERCALTPNA